MKLSIIIPVYNVEKFVGRCLNSCLQQNIPHKEYEIIVVNDGTEDDSMDIVMRYKNEYDNIVVINQDNKGLSCARNEGIKIAKGEYLWFVDSDDTIEENCLNFLLDTAFSNDLDVLCFNYYLIEEDNGKIASSHISHNKNTYIYNGKDFICKVSMPHPAWLSLYRKDFLKKHSLFFIEGIYYEDQEFTPRAYYLANRILYLDKPVYYYVQRKGSIMRGDNPQSYKKRAKDMLVVADSLYSFIGIYMKQDEEGYGIMLKNVAFAFSQSLKFYNKSYFPLQIYKSKNYYPFDLKVIGRYKLKYQIMNLSLNLYLFLLRIKDKIIL